MTDTTVFQEAVKTGYSFKGEAHKIGCAMLDGNVVAGADVFLPLKTMNRHGLIAGATGTGKTKTLQVLSEILSDASVPVLMMDIKGDLSGIAAAGTVNEKIKDRVQKLSLEFKPAAYPAELLTLSNEKGARLRATVSEFGPVLLSKILGLNDTQGGFVAMIFKYCDDNKLPLLDLKDFIKALLRGYEGIFDFPTSISETVLIRLLKKDVEAIKKDLLQLHLFGIIRYEPQKDLPQIYFPRNRVRMDDLTINMELYQKRKEKFSARVKNIIQFVQEKVICRSKMIGHYFGDKKIHSCGICDNCLRQKRLHIDEKEFEKISHRILTALAPQPLPSKDLIDQLGAFKKEKSWKVIEFLQAENKIEVDNAGWIRLK